MNIKDAAGITRPAYLPSKPTFGQMLDEAHKTLDRIERLWDMAYPDGDYSGDEGAVEDAYSEADDFVGQARRIFSEVEAMP